jgi:signal transduction histidine kinase/ligand-binding sensor domain-containing protein/CheY-like chemotaxis protein
MRWLLFKYFFILLLLFIAEEISCQNLRFSLITNKNGLPSSLVFSIEKDKQGFIWFGTNNGLARYDGYSCRVFQPDKNNPFSISDKSAFKLYCDNKNNLWIYILGRGLNRMDLTTEKFHYYFPDSSKYSISGSDINCVYEDKDSLLWVGSNKGVDLYDADNDRFIKCISIIGSQSVRYNNVIKLLSDKLQFMWYLTSSGKLNSFNKSNFKIVSIGARTGNAQLDKYWILDVAIDENNILWFSTYNNGLFSFDLVNGILKNYFDKNTHPRNLYIDGRGRVFVYTYQPQNTLIVSDIGDFSLGNYKSYSIFDGPRIYSILKFCEDKSNNIYITSNQGLDVLNYDGTISKYRSNIFVPATITDNHIENIYIDNTENLWVSFFRKAVEKADLTQKLFKWYLHDPSSIENSISGDHVSVIYEDRKDNLWIGSYGTGLTKFDRKSKTYTTIPIISNDPTKIIYEFPVSLYEDKQGFLWLGFNDGQMDRIDPNTLKIEHFTSLAPPSSSHYFEGWMVRKIIADKEDNLWIASKMGIIEFNRQSNKFIYHSMMHEKNVMGNYMYRTICVDKDGIIWSGTQSGGLIRYNKNIGKFKYYRNDARNKNSISSNTVYSIYDDNSEFLWIGTSEGLNRFDKKNETFERLCTDKGLNKYAIYCLLPDSLGNFWISSDIGLIKYNIKKSTFCNYYESDGLPSSEFNPSAYLLSKTGEMFFGTPNGMFSFYPEQIKQNIYKSRPVITDLKIFNKSIAPGDTLNGRVLLKKQIWATDEIILTVKENDLSLEFSALHYAAPEKNMYYYKMEGLKDEWITCDANHRWAYFSRLNPGKYTFRLKTTNNDNLLCNPEDEVRLNIFIKPPFWLSWWFKPTAAVLILGMVFYYFRKRYQRVKYQKMILEEKVKERTKEIEETNVMLEEKQEEINLQKEELTAQRDTLEDINNVLSKQKQQIIEQNIELDKHRNELESIVIKRTHELEEALNRAEESDRLKSSFLANMSHEIRTPMNAVIGFSSLLKDHSLSKKEKEDMIDIIISNGESLLVLISDILDLSKIQANLLVLNSIFINLPSLMNEIFESFQLEAKRKNVLLKLSMEKLPNGFILDTDRFRLKQVFDNLIINALKFTKEGIIEIGVSDIGNDITFFVRDTGIGIPPELKDSVFDRFLKIESKTQIFGGTGLGLAISKSLVELWGGKIWLSSELNKGTTFFFTHPYSIVHKKHIEEEKTKTLFEVPDLSNKTVLIGEDDENNFKVLSAFLLKTKATVVWVKDGSEAIKYVENNHVDIVLMDIKMPVIDGIEASKQIKKIKPEIPIIAQTAYAYENEKTAILNQGLDGYIAKPIRITELYKILYHYSK